MKTSVLFIKSLENERVKNTFGISGEEKANILESMTNSTIRLILTRHKQAATFFVTTYGRLSGKIGVS